jgi:hypothetical protein
MIQFNLILFLVFVIGINAGKIVEIQSRTSNDDLYAGMDTEGQLDLVICTETPDCCLIDNLDNLDNNFQIGAIDDFEGQYLQGCFNFEVPNDKIITFLVTHRGIDAWLGKWFRILFGDGNFVQCDITEGYWLDNEDELRLTCE